MAAIGSILSNRFVGWFLLLGGVALALKYMPYDWITTSDQRRVGAVGAATEMMMPSDLGYNLGRAAAAASACMYIFDKTGAEIALATGGNFKYRFIEPGGVLERVYNDGYQAARINGAPPTGYCDAALAEFGPSGRVIPTLIQMK